MLRLIIMKSYYYKRLIKRLNLILGESSAIESFIFCFLIILFCLLMMLIIIKQNILDHRIIAGAGIVIYFLTLTLIYIVKKNMLNKLDKTDEQLQFISSTDELTHAFNRKYFHKLFIKELERCKRYKNELGCLLIDIDNFKSINSKFGHETGDEILKDLAELIKDNLRITDIYARYGDNRFICSLPDTDQEQTIYFCKRLRRLLDRIKINHRESGETISFTISIGIVSCKSFVDKNTGKENIIGLAEKALETAKKSGGNRIYCYQ